MRYAAADFYAWYERHLARGAGALEDGQPAPRRLWNKIPEPVAEAVVELALKQPELSPRELATAFVDQQQYFVSEASVYRLLKAHDLITSPASILLQAADHFAQPTTAPNQLWQTDFTYLRVIGWGWFYLSTVLDDFSRYILAWKRCTAVAPAGGSLNFNSDGPDSLLILSRTCPKGSDDIQGPRLSARSRSRNWARMSFAGRPGRPALRRPRTPDYFRLYPTTICAPQVVDFLGPRAADGGGAWYRTPWICR